MGLEKMPAPVLGINDAVFESEGPFKKIVFKDFLKNAGHVTGG